MGKENPKSTSLENSSNSVLNSELKAGKSIHIGDINIIIPEQVFRNTQESLMQKTDNQTDQIKETEETLKESKGIFDHLNADVEETGEANIYQLVHELAHKKQVVLGVDQLELEKLGFYNTESALSKTSSDHTLLISGVEDSETDEVLIRIKDPLTSEEHSFSMEDFVDDWQDVDFSMASYKDPAAEESEDDHLEKIGQLPYESFKAAYDQLEEEGFKQIEDRENINELLADTVRGRESVEDFSKKINPSKEPVEQKPPNETPTDPEDEMIDEEEENEEDDMTGETEPIEGTGDYEESSEGDEMDGSEILEL